MNHVGISVTDIDVAMKWYEDVLGFSVVGAPSEIVVDNSTDMGFLLSQFYGPEMKRVKMGHMSAGNGVGLEFFQFVDPPTQYPNTTPGTNQKFEYARAGFFHICVTDPDPESLVKRIVETGDEQISHVLNIFRFL